jgi:hypothetical protein
MRGPRFASLARNDKFGVSEKKERRRFAAPPFLYARDGFCLAVELGGDEFVAELAFGVVLLGE